MNKKTILKTLFYLILIFAILFCFSTPKLNYEVNRVKTHEKVVMLTFDDGPTGDDLYILDIAKKYDVKFTFFQTGMNLDRYDEDPEIKMIVDRMINEGHTIGNHTYNHYNYSKDIDKAYREIHETNLLIQDVYQQNGITIHEKDIPVRMPFLQYYRGLGKVQKELDIDYFVRGYLGCDWDGPACGKEKILHQYNSHLRPGQILVAHTRKYAQEWLEEFIVNSLDQGYQFINFNDYQEYGKLVY